MTAVDKVLIVGGGPAGMTAAIALGRQGVEVDIVEVNPEWRPAGVGLLLQSPTLRALRSIGLLDGCVAAGYVHPEVRFCDAAGNVLYVVHPPLITGEQLPAVGITRPALHKVLEAAVSDTGTRVRLGVTVEKLEQGTDSVTVSFDDGDSDSYDLVVGADGVHSKVRKLVFPGAPEPTFTGQRIWRAGAPRPEGLRHYPIHFGANGKVGVVPISEQEVYVYLLHNDDHGRPEIARDALPGQMRAEMAGYNDLVDELRHSLYAVDHRKLVAMLMPSPWYAGRVLLIGDAAHATTPHLAFGVGMAIEDGIVLGELVAEQSPVPHMLDRFMERRYERCRLVVENSLLLGEWELHPVPEADPERVIRTTFPVLAQPL